VKPARQPLLYPPFVPTGRLRLRISHGSGGRAALRIYRPLTPRGRLLHAAAAAATALPPLPAVADPLLERLARLLGRELDGACVMASAVPGRRIVGVTSLGWLIAVAKVGCDGDEGLRHEVDVLRRLPPVPGVSTPRLLFSFEHDGRLVSVTEPLAGHRAGDPDAALAAALALARAGWTHGDLTPWNLSTHPLALLDWEAAWPGLVPFADLAHYVIHHEAHLGRGDPAAVLRRLCAPGSRSAAR